MAEVAPNGRRTAEPTSAASVDTTDYGGNFGESTGGTVLMVLEWVEGKVMGWEAERNVASYAFVSGNSLCINSRTTRAI
jgi:hypothetical protein